MLRNKAVNKQKGSVQRTGSLKNVTGNRNTKDEIHAFGLLAVIVKRHLPNIEKR